MVTASDFFCGAGGSSTGMAAAAAALGALDAIDALPELVQARHDTDEDVRNFAHWAVYMLDEWSGCHDLWDFLLAAARIAMNIPRQLRLF